MTAHGAAAAADLARLLAGLGRGGRVAVCEDASGAFASHLVDVEGAPAEAARHAAGNVWIGIARLGDDVSTGRGKAADVRALAALPIDLDVKPGGLPSWDAARAVVDTLAGIMGAEPVAVINTGHGLQPWWALDADDPAWQCTGPNDPRWSDMAAVVRRWGRLVARVAAGHGGSVDSVWDLARVMLVPGTVNAKDPSNPVPVTVERWGVGTPVSREQLLDALDAYGIAQAPDDRPATGAVVSGASGWAHGDQPCRYASAMVDGWRADTPGRSGRHPWLVSQATRLAAAHRHGCLTAQLHDDAAGILARRFAEIVADPALGVPRPTAPREVADALAWGVAHVEAMTDQQVADQLAGHSHQADPFGGTSIGLDEFVAHQRGYLDLPDPAHVLAALAVAATRDLDGDPVWLLLVAPPSSGKTETVRILDDVADAHLDDVTVAGLLSWSASKAPTAQGVLTRIGERGMITFGDMSSLLATSDRGGRDAVFGMLRRVYDGHAARDVGAPGGRPGGSLTWKGRATIVGAVTGAIDNYSAHADKLGPRWLYVRLAGRDTASRRRAARAARQKGLPAHRAQSRALAAALVRRARDLAPGIEVPRAVEEAIEDAALVTCWGRATVPRSGYGRKDPEGAPEVEDPPRLIRQALMLAGGLLALGLDADATATLARRCILDSMPATRRAVLQALAQAEGEMLTTTAVSRAAGLHRHVARIALEDLQVVGAVSGHRVGDEPEDEDEDREDRRRRQWTLAPNADGQLVADVLEAHAEAMDRWHETWELPTPPPLPSSWSPGGDSWLPGPA